MADQAFILCVDDEPINITIMEELLTEKYRVECVGSGRACLDVIEQRRPDLVLLDVNMPDMDGLETCQALKNNPATCDIPVIFVSVLATEAELMAGYQAGGDDYITKPFSENILQRKIEIVLESEAKKQQLLEMTDSAVEAMMRSHGSMSDLEMVVNFLHDCFKQSEIHGLSKVVFNYLNRLQLESSLMFIVEPEPHYWFSDDIDRPMERQILLNLNGQDRIVKFGSRMAINCSSATLLVRNMPDDEDKLERLTRHLIVVIEGLDARLKSMETGDTLSRLRRALDTSINHTRKQLDDVKGAVRKQRSKADRLNTKLLIDLELLVQKAGLEASQVKVMLQRLKRFREQAEKLNDERELMHDRVEKLIGEIIDSLTDKL